MSIELPREVKCPDCGTENAVIIHNSINVTVDPEKKAKVLDRSLFKFRCQKCGAETELSYCPLYHDMNEKYMIGVVPDKKAAYEEKVPDIGTSMGSKFSMLADGYRFRIVCGITGLIEKIKIFDSKLDDYAVETVKLLIYQELKKPKNIFFCGADKEDISFFVMYENSENDKGIRVNRKCYNMATKILADKKIDRKDVQYVDMEIIAHAFSEKTKKE